LIIDDLRKLNVERIRALFS
jgi:hypothetical protein